MSELANRVKEGLDGKFKGLANGFTNLNKVLFGVQKKCYTLIGGASGNYKTTLLDFILDNAITDAESQGIPIDVFYYSFEIDKLTKECNALSRAVKNKFGVIIPPEMIKGLGDNRMTPEQQIMVDQCIPEVEERFNKIKFFYDGVNPTGIYYTIYEHCKKHGTLHYENYTDSSGIAKKRVVGYTPNEDRYFLIALDHLALTPLERGFTTKQNIDKLSQYFITLRNMFNCTFLVLSQFNQGLSNVERAKFKGIDLSPSQGDFKDSTTPYADCDVAIGLMNPWKLDMNKNLNYDITHFKDKFLHLKVIKNRLSRDNVAQGLYVRPESGSFEELPPANEIDYNDFK